MGISNTEIFAHSTSLAAGAPRLAGSILRTEWIVLARMAAAYSLIALLAVAATLMTDPAPLWMMPV